MDSHSLIKRLAVLTGSEYLGRIIWGGRSVPLTISKSDRLPVISQQMVWYSFPNGCSFLGQKQSGTGPAVNQNAHGLVQTNNPTWQKEFFDGGPKHL